PEPIATGPSAPLPSARPHGTGPATCTHAATDRPWRRPGSGTPLALHLYVRLVKGAAHARSRVHPGDPRVLRGGVGLRPRLRPGLREGGAMDLELWTGVAVTLFLVAYLFYALLRPESF